MLFFFMFSDRYVNFLILLIFSKDNTLVQYIPKVIDFFLRINLNFLFVFFILMPPSNSIDSTSSFSSRALESWTNTISSDTNCCEHNLGYHTYYDTNSYEIQRFPSMTSNTPWDRLPRAHKMNIKIYKKKNTQFNVIPPKLDLRSRGVNLREIY